MTHSLFIPPRFHRGNEEELRRVTWLELFYDLVYVATIVQLGNRLSDDVSVSGFVSFALVFAPVWWLWVGMTFYSNRFDSDDVIHRLLIFAQIFVVTVLAMNIYNATSTTGEGFALAYAAARVIYVVMYLRAYYAVPEARALTRRYIIGFSIAAAFWLVSAFVPAPLRYVLWAIGLAIDFYTPLSRESVRLQPMLPPSPRHLPERFGLFTIIVIGESFLKMIGELSGHIYEFSSLVADIPGLLIVISLWWIYFDDIAESFMRWRGWVALVWTYAHLPLHLGITVLSVGVYKLVQRAPGELLSDDYRWLICGAAALCLVAIGMIELATRGEDGRKIRYDFILRLAGAAVLLVIAAVGGGLEVTLMMMLIALPCLAQVAFDIYWRWRSLPAGVALEAAGD